MSFVIQQISDSM